MFFNLIIVIEELIFSSYYSTFYILALNEKHMELD